jgi:hypothetical protein
VAVAKKAANAVAVQNFIVMDWKIDGKGNSFFRLRLTRGR